MSTSGAAEKLEASAPAAKTEPHGAALVASLEARLALQGNETPADR